MRRRKKAKYILVICTNSKEKEGISVEELMESQRSSTAADYLMKFCIVTPEKKKHYQGIFDTVTIGPKASICR